MIANIGYFALVLALACTAYATVLGGMYVWRREPAWLASARQAALLTLPLLTLSAILLVTLIVTNQFQVEYVYSVTSLSMPTYLKVTALWGGQAGSLLFWAWLMSLFTSSALLGKWDRDRGLMPVVIMVMMITLGFFIGLVVFFENPFARLWQTFESAQPVAAMLQPANAIPFIPADGRGLNPLLRHPGMIIHPPMLYLGFVGFVVPFAFGMAALATRRTDDEWLRTSRRWTLIGWLFLSLGLLLGGRWAYDVLGWGGYWGWDPVENAALMPWLTGTAFLHSSMIQEKRGMLKKWNMVLIILTYALVLYGTFLTRSGVLSSVHAFAQSAIGPSFFVFIGATFIGALVLLFRAWDDLRSENQLDSLLSREAAFLLNNLLFLGITASVFWGTNFPMISEIFTGQTVTVGPPFYHQVVGPQIAALVLLMGVAPLFAWRKTSPGRLGRLLFWPEAVGVVAALGLVALGVRSLPALIGVAICTASLVLILIEFYRGTAARMKVNAENALAGLVNLLARNRRRYGGYIIHLGVVVMGFGVIGSTFFQLETQGRIGVGEQLTIGRYVMIYDRLDEFNTDDNRNVARATISVFRDGRLVAELHPRRDFYFDSGQPMTIPGVRSTFEDDFYALLVDWEPIGSQAATFKLYVNPLVNWVWAGGLIFILGTLVAVWPEAADERRALAAARPLPSAARFKG